MSSRREQILQALYQALHDDGFFPSRDGEGDGARALCLDEPEPTGWRTLSGAGLDGLIDCANVADGPFEATAEVLGADDDPSAAMVEGVLDAVVAYCVAGEDKDARRARRDAGALRIEAVVRADPTLGMDFDCYARVSDATRDDDAPVPAGAPVANVIATIEVTYAATSPLG